MSDTDSFEDLQFTSMSQRTYFAEARLGLEVEEFLRSNTGKLLQHRAVQQCEEAKQAMCYLDIDKNIGQSEYKQHQFNMKVAEQFLYWCVEAIRNGQTSEQLVHELEENGA